MGEEMREDETIRNGVQVRREMFGTEVTDSQIAQANQFTRPMQDVVSKYCFGETWTRDGLSRRAVAHPRAALLR